MYDLLLKGGTVVDASVNLNGVNDIAVQDGKIARTAPDIASEEAAQAIASASSWVPVCSIKAGSSAP